MSNQIPCTTNISTEKSMKANIKNRQIILDDDELPNKKYLHLHQSLPLKVMS